jgi:hypothetical protein
MLKIFSICAALVAVGAGSVGAHEREAILQKIEVPDASFDMLVATTRSPNPAIYDLGDSPDALVIHLIGGELWLGFDDGAKMLDTLDMLQRPVGSFHLENPATNPIAVYLVPKRKALARPI